MKYFVTISLLLGLIALPACAQTTKTISWKEEVKLSSGQVIVVRRSHDYRRVYAGGGFHLSWLCYRRRVEATLQNPRREVKWEGTPIPMALDVAGDGRVYLVAMTVAGRSGKTEYGGKLEPGRTYHVAYQLGANQDRWQLIPVTAVPSKFRPNLMVNTYGLFVSQGSKVTFVGLGLKAKVDSDPRIRRNMRDWPRK